jgi:hypothetical protein
MVPGTPIPLGPFWLLTRPVAVFLMWLRWTLRGSGSISSAQWRKSAAADLDDALIAIAAAWRSGTDTQRLPWDRTSLVSHARQSRGFSRNYDARRWAGAGSRRWPRERWFLDIWQGLRRSGSASETWRHLLSQK